MLWTTNESIGDETQSIQTKNQDVLSTASGVNGGEISKSIKNLSIVANLAKSTRSKLKGNFAKANSKPDFLTLEAKKAFIYLQKAFTKALILRHFDPEHHI